MHAVLNSNTPSSTTGGIQRRKGNERERDDDADRNMFTLSCVRYTRTLADGRN